MHKASFLNTSGIPYHNAGAQTHLKIMRTPDAISVLGSINGGADTPGGVMFHACTNASSTSLRVNGATREGDDLPPFIKALKLAKEQLRSFQTDLDNFSGDHQDYVNSFEDAVRDYDGEDSLFVHLALRPLSMRQSHLDQLVGLSAHYVQHMNRTENYLASLKGSFDHWRYDVLMNALAEAGITGSDDEVQARFFDMTCVPDISD